MKATYLGHSAFQVEMNGKRLVFDPYISPNPLASHIKVDDIQADYILLSHGHGDHTADAERIARKNGATIVGSYELVCWFEEKGLKGHSMNHGGKWKFDFGWVKMVSAIHSSSLPDKSYGGNPSGFVVWDERECFYFAGDTALTLDMKLIPLTCPKLGFAILPLGDNYTMGFEDAATAAEFLECDTVVGCHYDTFEFIRLDRDAAKKHFSEKGKRLLLPRPRGNNE